MLHYIEVYIETSPIACLAIVIPSIEHISSAFVYYCRVYCEQEQLKHSATL